MMFLACNQVIATSPPQTIVMGEQFFDPSVVKHPPHRVPASFIYYLCRTRWTQNKVSAKIVW